MLERVGMHDEVKGLGLERQIDACRTPDTTARRSPGSALSHGVQVAGFVDLEDPQRPLGRFAHEA